MRQLLLGRAITIFLKALLDFFPAEQVFGLFAHGYVICTSNFNLPLLQFVKLKLSTFHNVILYPFWHFLDFVNLNVQVLKYLASWGNGELSPLCFSLMCRWFFKLCSCQINRLTFVCSSKSENKTINHDSLQIKRQTILRIF